MKKNGKKYILKESELKEIIRDMMLMEIYDPNDYKDMYVDKSLANKPTANLGDYAGAALKAIRGIPGLIIPDAWKERVANGDNDFAKWLLHALAAEKIGSSVGPDRVPNFGQWNGKTQNANAEEPLSVSKACNFILRNASARPTNWCARHVRMALNYGGLHAPWGMYAPSAKYYVNILPGNGWDEISPDQAGEPCDIVVIDSCIDSSGKKHGNGHIAMCAGNGKWVSDFVQNTVYGLKGTPPASCVHFYRYRNRVQ